MPTVRWATREDIDAFSPMRNKPTVMALCMEHDGEIIALGGCARVNGRFFGFCDLTKEARPYRMHIARAAKRFMAYARERGVRFIYAEADPNEKTAVRWLTSLGFKIDPRTQYLYRWSHQ